MRLRRIDSPLVRDLLSQGMARPDPLNLGLDVTTDSAVIKPLGRALAADLRLGAGDPGAVLGDHLRSRHPRAMLESRLSHREAHCDRCYARADSRHRSVTIRRREGRMRVSGCLGAYRQIESQICFPMSYRRTPVSINTGL